MFFHHGLNDTIYKLSDDEIHAFLLVDFGTFSVPYQKISNIKNSKLYDEKVYFNNPNYIGNIKNLLVNNRIFTFTFSKITTGYTELLVGEFNRLTDSVNFYNSSITKIHGLTFFHPKFIDNKKTVYVIYPFEMGREEQVLIKNNFNIIIDNNSNPLLLTVYE